jgi:beta-1,4-mannosyltransferase
VATFRVVQVSRVRLNPYVRLLQDALIGAGVPCSTIEQLGPSSLPPGDGLRIIVHLHWLELQYTSANWIRSVRRLLAVVSALVLVKLKGGKVVYTVHNLSPHEQRFPKLSAMANRVLFALADALHVHDEQSAARVAQLLGTPPLGLLCPGAKTRGRPPGRTAYPLLGDGRAGRIHIVPHASYVGAYPDTCTREAARTRLGLPEGAFVYLFFGQMRRYKGIEDLIAAFGQLDAAAGNEHLMLAGHIHDPSYAQELALAAQGRPGIHTWFRYVDDAEVQYFMHACDVCVLPYRDVTTSGAAILAFSFGKPIVAPALGGFPELVSDGRGIVYDPQQVDGLLRAMQQSRSADMTAAGERARAWAREHDWRALVPQFVRIYQGTLQTDGNSPSGGSVDTPSCTHTAASHGGGRVLGGRSDAK